MSRVRELFREYAATVEAEPCFHGFEAELEGLPGAYGGASGALLVAYAGARAVGCVAVRELAGATDHGLVSPGDGVRRAELKRLFVRREARGKGVARALARAAVEHARRAGYAGVRLDTLPTMREAMALYRSMGFEEIAPSGCACAAEARFFELALGPSVEIEDMSGALSREALGWLREKAGLVMGRLGSRHGAGGSVRARVIRDAEMAELHGKHSGDATTTDVLTFDLREDGGGRALDVDVFVCVDEAERAGVARGHAPEAELLLYLLHACLHCLGFDDGTEEASARMHGEEDAVLREAGLPAIYSAPTS